MDVVVVGGCFKRGFGPSVLPGEAVEVRVFDANRFGDLKIFVLLFSENQQSRLFINTYRESPRAGRRLQLAAILGSLRSPAVFTLRDAYASRGPLVHFVHEDFVSLVGRLGPFHSRPQQPHPPQPGGSLRSPPPSREFGGTAAPSRQRTPPPRGPGGMKGRDRLAPWGSRCGGPVRAKRGSSVRGSERSENREEVNGE